MKMGVNGFVKISDRETGEILAKSNAVHYGNITKVIANGLSNDSVGHITAMVFGNGGSTIDSSGVIVYRVPDVSTLGNSNATLHRETYNKSGNAIRMAVETADNVPYADIVIQVTLGVNEPSGQDIMDQGNGMGNFVFDEIGLKAKNDQNNDVLITHVIFHPVQKSQNRIIDIEYTLRVQMGITN